MVVLGRCQGRELLWQYLREAAGAVEVEIRVGSLTHLDFSAMSTTRSRRDRGLDDQPLPIS